MQAAGIVKVFSAREEEDQNLLKNLSQEYHATLSLLWYLFDGISTRAFQVRELDN